MADFKVEIAGLDKLQNAFKNYPQISEPIMQKAMDATAAIFAKYTLKGDPVPWRTGNLLQSFRHQSSRLQARWYPTANYALFVEFGRGVVLPVNKLALSWKDAGRRIFAKRSRPANARPFMQKIVDKSTEDINKVFGSALDAINRRIADSTK
jgi:hypothetical protein